MRKTYATPYEHFTLARDGIVFTNGTYSTENEHLQQCVEANPKFGNKIWLVTEAEAKLIKGEKPDEVDLEDSPEIFTCDQCDAEFTTKESLNGHKGSHGRKK